jgi:hypothetical protein
MLMTTFLCVLFALQKHERSWLVMVMLHVFASCNYLLQGSHRLKSSPLSRRWCFDVELIYLAKALRILIKEVAVAWTEIPGSKLRVTSIFHMRFELALVRLGYGMRLCQNICQEQRVQSSCFKFSRVCHACSCEVNA